MCFAIASLFTYGKGLQFSKFFYYRDAAVYFITALLLMSFLIDNKIYLYEAIILIFLWPIYILINVLIFSRINDNLEKKEKLLENDEKNQDNIINEEKKYVIIC